MSEGKSLQDMPVEASQPNPSATSRDMPRRVIARSPMCRIGRSGYRGLRGFGRAGKGRGRGKGMPIRGGRGFGRGSLIVESSPQEIPNVENRLEKTDVEEIDLKKGVPSDPEKKEAYFQKLSQVTEEKKREEQMQHPIEMNSKVESRDDHPVDNSRRDNPRRGDHSPLAAPGMPVDNSWVDLNKDLFEQINKNINGCGGFGMSVVGTCAVEDRNPFSGLDGLGDSLLYNAHDKAGHEEAQRSISASKSLTMKLGLARGQTVEELKDHFKETNNHVISPQYLVDELEKVRHLVETDPELILEEERILKEAAERGDVENLLKEKVKVMVNLPKYCVNNFLVNKIDQLYQKRYGRCRAATVSELQSEYGEKLPNGVSTAYLERIFGKEKSPELPSLLERMNTPRSELKRLGGRYYVPMLHVWNGTGGTMEKYKLLAVIESLIERYECLADDRFILDQTDELGDEIASVVSEYQELTNRIEKFGKFATKLRGVKTLLAELWDDASALTDESSGKRLVHSVADLGASIMMRVEELAASVDQDQIDRLASEAQKCQAKFNYYSKMAEEIQKRVSTITSFNCRGDLPMPSMPVCNYSPNLSRGPLQPATAGVWTTSDMPQFFSDHQAGIGVDKKKIE